MAGSGADSAINFVFFLDLQGFVQMATGAAAKLRGEQFEKEVEALLRSLGYWRVRRNVILKDVHGNTSQIDLVCGLWKRIYVECKCYQDPVPLVSDIVLKFKKKDKKQQY